MEYYMPTKIFAGRDCVAAHAEVFGRLGGKALLVTGRSAAKRCGALADVLQVLEKNGQLYAVYDGVMNNPTPACVYEGAAMARAERADFIIAIGGGSPMDAAKAIALVYAQDLPREQLFSNCFGDQMVPTVLIPTTAGTGSEVTQYAVLTNAEKQTKTSVKSPILFPKYCFLDARYTESLDARTAGHTAIDALSHAVEGMLSVRSSVLTDVLARQSISMIASCFDALKSGVFSAETRETLLTASCMAGMVIANTGTTAVHAMGYGLTFFKDLPHGFANGLLLAPFLAFCARADAGRVREILRCMGMEDTAELDACLRDILGERVQASEQEVRRYCAIAIQSANISNSRAVPSEGDLSRLYRQGLAMF